MASALNRCRLVYCFVSYNGCDGLTHAFDSDSCNLIPHTVKPDLVL